MIVTKNENVVWFDVDGTIIRRPKPGAAEGMLIPTGNAIEFERNGTTERLVPMMTHINLLKEFHNRGFHVIVHSHSGWKWAETVVTKLGLEPYVDEVKSKARDYVDDLDANAWMQRLFISTE